MQPTLMATSTSEEVKVMLEKSDFDTVEKVEKLFDKMNDKGTMRSLDKSAMISL